MTQAKQKVVVIKSNDVECHRVPDDVFRHIVGSVRALARVCPVKLRPVLREILAEMDERRAEA